MKMQKYLPVIMFVGILSFAISAQATFATAPPNDHFWAAEMIVLSNNGSFLGTRDNVSASKEASEPDHAENVGGSSVWFHVTPMITGIYRIKTTDPATAFDTTLAVYTGGSLPTLTRIGYNDDCRATGCGGTSMVDLMLTAGTKYRIAVDGYNSGQIAQTGNFVLSITGTAGPIGYDAIALAYDLGISLGGSIAGTNYNATREAGEPNHWSVTFPGQKSVWYRWKAPSAKVVKFEVTEDFDSQMTVYESDSPNATFAQLWKITASLDHNGDSIGRHHVIFNSKPDKWYYIVIAGHTVNPQATDSGNFQLKYGPNPMRYSLDSDARDTAASIGIFRPSEGNWYIRNHGLRSQGYSILQWGTNGDTPMAADFNGDGATEMTIARNENGLKIWYMTPIPTPTIFHWGLSTDKAVAGDYDGDGRADPTVIRTTAQGYVWYVRQSSNGGMRAFVFGTTGDKPVFGNFDNHIGTDVAFVRNTQSGMVWYVLRSSSNYVSYYSVQFGATSDVVAPEDYDGDGKTDIAVFRPSTATWYILRSSTGQVQVTTFGANGDKPQPGDYDSDGKADLAMFRPSTGEWFFWLSRDGSQQSIQWGANGDIPISSLATLSQ